MTYTYKKDNVTLTSDYELAEGEAFAYIDRGLDKYGEALESINAHIDGNEVELTYRTKPFDRIRRITGYLVGTMNRWNDGKRAEEHDRVKHTVK